MKNITLKPIREVVGDIVGQYIQENKWDEVFQELNISGWLDSKTMQQIVLELCKRLELMEHEQKN